MQRSPEPALCAELHLRRRSSQTQLGQNQQSDGTADEDTLTPAHHLRSPRI
ncbi:MAG: hypothetical protein HC852_23165 [Acaryochloridaceae cyanobacterium RU_4_10]|nr:hypothetical protein [Acaryochloridaceae cyanobacterium RU_4_10]